MRSFPGLWRFRFNYLIDAKFTGEQLIHNVAESPVPVNRGFHAGSWSPGAKKRPSLEIMVDFPVQLFPFFILYPPPDWSHEAGVIRNVQVSSTWF